MKTSRKYNLNLKNVISCGIGTYTGDSRQYSLLKPFVSLSFHSYSGITTEELKSLSISNYNNRVIDFLNNIKIENDIHKTELFSGATYNDSQCSDYFCLLNSDFLIYKFLSGIRIINVGSANGIVEYKVYPYTGDSNNYDWQSNPTFLNLDSNGIYMVVIRDYISDSDIVVCECNKLLSMSHLIPSTTVTLPPTIIGLKEITSDTDNNLRYKTGCVKINPILSEGQKTKIYYTANALLIGGGCSCVVLTCKPYCGNAYNNIVCITDTNSASPVNGSFIMSYKDTICYNISSCVTQCGSCANANFALTSANGLSTITPIIDSTNYSASTLINTSSLDIVVSINRTNGINPDLNTCTVCGVFGFTPSIQTNQCIMIELSAITTTVGGTSNICFYRTHCSNNFIGIANFDYLQLQPQTNIITMCYCDCLCYEATVIAPRCGSCSCEIFGINNLTASLGIVPIPSSTSYFENSSISKSKLPIMISLCNQSISNNNSNGYVNPSVTILPNECVNVNFSYSLSVNHYTSSANFIIKCKPYMHNNYVTICSVETNGDSTNGTGSFIMREFDTLCYSLNIDNSVSSAGSTINLDSVTSSIGLTASINVDKYCDCVGVIV